MKRKRKKRSQSPEVIAIRSPEVISLSPGETSPVSRVCKTTTTSLKANNEFFFCHLGLSLASSSACRAASNRSNSKQDDRGSQGKSASNAQQLKKNISKHAWACDHIL